MLLLINDLDLEAVPQEPIIPGETLTPQFYKYLIKNDVVVGDWIYLLKNVRFTEVTVKDKILYSLVQLNLDLDYSLWIDSKEKIKYDIYISGKICKEEARREILELKFKTTILENKLQTIAQYLNLNI